MSFDHRDPGSDPDRWSDLVRTLDTEPLDVLAAASVLVLAPHPDDETLGAGALIAVTADAGLDVLVLLATRGEASHPDSPTASPDRLAAIRDTETTAALHLLHHDVASRQLGLPDGGLREHRAELEEGLRAALGTLPPPVLLVAPWHEDGHRDHRIAAEVARDVVADRADVTLVEYPIWMWHWDDPASPTAPWERVRSLSVPEHVLDRKRRAIAAYRSQVEPLSDGPGDEAIVDQRHVEHFTRTVEPFFPVPTTTAPSGPSRSADSFRAHYERHPEGWDFEGSWYERRKRAVTLAALPRERYRAALELGCATGVLTRALTERADHVLGTDLVEAPLALARRNAPDAEFRRMTVPGEWPDGAFDLVVLSEVGYYLSAEDLDRTIDRVLACLDDDGVLVACHWRHPDTEAVSDGDTVHARLRERWPRPALVSHVEEDFVLEVLPGAAVRSVAHDTGILG